MTASVRSRILELVAGRIQRPVSELSLSDSPESLGLDSMALVELLFAVEEAFDLSLPWQPGGPDAGGPDLSSLGALIAAVEAELGSPRG